MNQADLARATGIDRRLIGEYWQGRKTPGADNALSLADALAVTARWLIRGAGAPGPVETSQEDDEWVTLPRYDFLGFTEHGKPPEEGRVAVRKEWLGRWGNASRLWVAEMPSDAPEIAKEGDFVLCMDPEPGLVDGRVYAFLFNGRFIARRVQIKADGVALKEGRNDPDPLIVGPDQLEQLIPIARVIATIGVQPV